MTAPIPSRLRRALGLAGRTAGPRPAHPVTVAVDAARVGPPVPEGFAGLSFERGPLNPGNAGVAGYLFSPRNASLVGLFRNLGLRNLRIGGGSVDAMPPAGVGGDGFTGIDNLFAFAAEAGVEVIYSLRLLSPAAQPIADLESLDARIAGRIWGRYREHVASFAIGNEPDWHAFHSYDGHRLDPAIREEVSGVPGSAYPSYLQRWRDVADAVLAAAPGARLCGPDTGAYDTTTYTPAPESGVSWTERFAADEQGSGRIAEITQHHYVGGGPGRTTARQAIGNMLSGEWLNGGEPGTQPAGTAYIPYPWLYASNIAPAAAVGLRCRLTESNDYLAGVPGASDAFASALWALDYLHWWAAHGAAGVNFHNKQWLRTDTIVPDPAGGGRYAATPKGYGIKAFTLGSAGRVKRVRIANPAGINVTAYCVGGPDRDCVTIINKTHGAGAADAEVTIALPGERASSDSPDTGRPARAGPPSRRAEVMTLVDGDRDRADAAGSTALLGGDLISGDRPFDGTWEPLPADPRTGVSLIVRAATAAVVRVRPA